MASTLTLRKDDLSWTSSDGDQIVILDRRTSRYMSLNAAAAQLWTRLSDSATQQDLVAYLEQTFGLGTPDAERDVDNFLGALRERDLLVSSDG